MFKVHIHNSKPCRRPGPSELDTQSQRRTAHQSLRPLQATTCKYHPLWHFVKYLEESVLLITSSSRCPHQQSGTRKLVPPTARTPVQHRHKTMPNEWKEPWETDRDVAEQAGPKQGKLKFMFTALLSYVWQSWEISAIPPWISVFRDVNITYSTQYMA